MTASKNKWQTLNEDVELLFKQGLYDRALAVGNKALRIAEQSVGPDHNDVADILSNLAALYRSQGKYRQAEPLYKRSLAIKEKVLGPEHLDVAMNLSGLAFLYYSQGQYGQAEPLCKRSLAIREKALGPEHLDVAATLNNLAHIYRAQGLYAIAETLLKRSLEIEEKSLGPEHLDVAESLSRLASLYYSEEQYGQAESLYKRSLVIKEKALGTDHPDVASCLNNLAMSYFYEGQYEQVGLLHKRSLAIREKAFGPEHPDVATSLNNLALLYYSSGQYAQAMPLYTRSLAILKKTLGPSHPNVANTLDNIAALYRKLGKKESEGEALEMQAASIRAINKRANSDEYGAKYTFHALAQQGSLVGLKNLVEPLDKQHRRAILNGRDHRGFTVLHKAMEIGDLATVSYLLENGAEINARVTGPDPEGWTALHLAAFDDHPDVIELLVKHNAKLDPVGAGLGRMTPLKVAITKEKVASALKLIKLGANVFHKDENNFTLLHEACNFASVEIAKALLSKGVEVDSVAGDHTTPLCWAIRSGRLKLVQLLLNRGADPNYRGPNGESPLMAAKAENAGLIMLILKKAGARE